MKAVSDRSISYVLFAFVLGGLSVLLFQLNCVVPEAKREMEALEIAEQWKESTEAQTFIRQTFDEYRERIPDSERKTSAEFSELGAWVSIRQAKRQGESGLYWVGANLRFGCIGLYLGSGDSLPLALEVDLRKKAVVSYKWTGGVLLWVMSGHPPVRSSQPSQPIRREPRRPVWIKTAHRCRAKVTVQS